MDGANWRRRLQPLRSPPAPRGASIQVRFYAEDPAQATFSPAPACSPKCVPHRCGSTPGSTGSEVPPNYDPMIAKLIVTGNDRECRHQAAGGAGRHAPGRHRNQPGYLRQVAADDVFAQGRQTTRTWHDLHTARKHWRCWNRGADHGAGLAGAHRLLGVGVPPSGPMDDLAMRLANRLVGNAPKAAAWNAP
jgi:urea carboxylase